MLSAWWLPLDICIGHNLIFCFVIGRVNPNSHQQRWGSDEDKVNQPAPAIQNTYTALALHDSSELPPSPLSPMPSSIGIDPKWEFPRENIQLSDVLAEGQFTVLYKGIARNLKEKACEVAVKAVKGKAQTSKAGLGVKNIYSHFQLITTKFFSFD